MSLNTGALRFIEMNNDTESLCHQLTCLSKHSVLRVPAVKFTDSLLEVNKVEGLSKHTFKGSLDNGVWKDTGVQCFNIWII